MLMIVGLLGLIVVNLLVLSVGQNRAPLTFLEKMALAIVTPFQHAATRSVAFVDRQWRYYFDLVTAARENDHLKKALLEAKGRQHDWQETLLANQRLRHMLAFRQTVPFDVIAAEVIARSPSPWFHTVLIDKGQADGMRKGLPVVVPNGIVGQITDVSFEYAKVMLIVDASSSADAMVQRSRARGIISGDAGKACRFKYVLRKDDVKIGDVIITSGLDGVYPKGQPLGRVSGLVQRTAGVFQDVSVMPEVDFETLEEVLIILNPPQTRMDPPS